MNGPPDAAEAPEGATDQSALDKRLAQDPTAHKAHECATCLLGLIPWTPARRQESATYAACSGRRITHLDPVEVVDHG